MGCDSIDNGNHNVPGILVRPVLKFGVKNAQGLVSLYGFYMTNMKNRDQDQRPTFVKYYPELPQLPNHVWIPKSHVSGSDARLLPLLIDIHGGGFMIGHPFLDDRDNAIFCHKYGICVVSINYRKVPNRFPVPVKDVATLIQCVLDDPDLPVDKARVAIIGYSAGGNLALTGPQMNNLHKKIKGVVAYYPVTDFVRTVHQRKSDSTPPPNRRDILARGMKNFNWIYLGRHHKHDLKNPLASPLWAERSKLPEKIYILGCEYDVLFGEARDAAIRYADLELAESEKKREPLGDGRTGWKSGNVTWEELKDLEHGFNQRWPLEIGKRRKEWKKRTLEIHANVADWLFREVYMTRQEN
ncbi:uncharacterized protein PV09_05377 [Verruconis gallopava]|uniref:Alpha/beta hydrolase fold-3 domain-containing protein n=1 Tax=Verruconis gallopava TaxID=253628 RepID=A0A0D2AAM2_9PEZI|nr:uncharacterized protein PV09_05377 [Verruconis gallopava]KIW03625.1 hypothetical protein PV09_05377 [Verruconis gallopava]